MLDKWDGRFLELAKHIASWSKDPSSQVGTVIVDAKRRVLGVGYNGLPRGVEDKQERLENREIKYPCTVHSEINALLNSTGNLEGATVYTHGRLVCGNCAAALIQVGIARSVMQGTDYNGSQSMMEMMFKEAGVSTLILSDVRE